MTPHLDGSSGRRLGAFLALSGFSGVTAGMLRVLTAIFAIRLGADSVQIGIVSSLEAFAMAAMTLPVGLLVSRFGARPIYVAGSAAITLVYSLAPLALGWRSLAIAVGAGGLFMSFRMVALNGSFLEQLRSFGQEKAGWYRSANVVGFLLIGPALATLLLESSGVGAGYWMAAALFALMGVIGAFNVPKAAVMADRPVTFGRSIGDMVRTARHPLVAQIAVIELSSGFVLAFFTGFIVLVGVRHLGLSEPVAVSVRFAEGIISVCTMTLAGSFLTRQVPIHLYRASVALMVCGLVVLGLADRYAALVLGATLLGIGFGVVQLVNVQQLSLAEVAKGKVASLQLMSSMSGGFIGAALGGVLAKQFGFGGMFFCAAAIYAALSMRWCFGRAASRPIPLPAE